MSALHLADGPAMFFGSTIMSFALPLGGFIVIALAVFLLLRNRHSGPQLRYLSTASIPSVITREPGPAPAPKAEAASATAEARAPEAAAPEAAAPEAAAPEAAAPEAAAPEAAAPKAEPEASAEESKDGEEQ